MDLFVGAQRGQENGMEQGGSSELGVPGSGQDPSGPGGSCEPLPRGAGDFFGCADTETFPLLSPYAMIAPVRVIPGDEQP